MAIISGKNIKVRYGATPTAHKVTSLNIEDEAGEIDTTNSESGGYGEVDDAGIVGATVRLEGDYDVGAAPLVDLAPGNLIEPLTIYLNGLSSQPNYVFTSFRVIRCTTGAEVKGKVKFSLYGKSNGSFTRPTT